MISVPEDEELVDLNGDNDGGDNDIDGGGAEDHESPHGGMGDDNAAIVPTFAYRDCEMWLNQHALPRYLRKLDGTRKWAPNWFDYPEADTLIQALWETWEQMRWDGAQAMLVYYRDYFYPLMDRLTSTEGPFHSYDETTHPHLPKPWRTVRAPTGHFPQVET